MIKDLQLEYVELIESTFNFELDQLKDIEFDDLEETIQALKDKSLITGTFSSKRTFLDNKFDYYLSDLKKYWDKSSPIIEKYLNETKDSSIVIWPNDPILELLPRYLLYYDTVLIPDPIMSMGKKVISDKQYRDAFLFFIIVGKLKYILKNESSKPNIIFVPYMKRLSDVEKNKNNSDFVSDYSASEISEIAKEAFKKAVNLEFDFKDPNDLFEQLGKYPVKKLNQGINLPFIKTIINFIIEDPKFLQRAYNNGTLDFIVKKRLLSKTLTQRDFVNLHLIFSSLFSVFEIREYNSAKLNTINLISSTELPIAEFKHQTILKSYGHALKIDDKELMNYSMKENFTWLDNINIVECLELRNHSSLEEYRSILNQESSKIKSSSYQQFPSMAKDFEENILQKLNVEHQKIEKMAESLLRKRRLSIGSFVISSGLTFTSMAFPTLIPLAVIATAAGVFGGAGIKDIYSDVIKVEGKIEELERKPISLIYKASQKKLK